MIDIAHPDDLVELANLACKAGFIYADQIYLRDSGHFYDEKITTKHIFSDGINVSFRAIKPSDKEAMQRFFHRFSSDTIFPQFFSQIKTMPDFNNQECVNIDYHHNMSIVGILEEGGIAEIIVETRYGRHEKDSLTDTTFVVDEKYNG